MPSKIKQICLGGSFVATLIATPFIVKWEGTENRAYQDIVGVWTICSGETKNVRKGQHMTDSECVALTQERILEFAEGVDDLVTVPMTAKYHASLTSWAYNVGLGAASKSTLVRVLNRGDYEGACEQLIKKDYSSGRCRGYGCGYAGGLMVRGLQNRRQDEHSLCVEGID
tara:strand:- start:22360 stop:22869 length:510 start_codon:yes stop_codon:yes gene_type:complete